MRADLPNILDYGADPTGQNSSADAMEALIADINAEKRTGYLPKGRFVIDRYCGSLIHSALMGELTGQDALDTAQADEAHPKGRQGVNSTTIVIPRWAGMAEGVGADDNWARFGVGSGVFNVNFQQPDQTAARIEIEDKGFVPGDPLIADDVEIFLGNYSRGGEVLGAPDSYPYVVQSEHRLNDDGTLIADGGTRNGGRIRAWNIGLIGVMGFLWVGDDHPTNQKGVSGIDVQNVRGFCIGTDMVIRGLSGVGQIQNVSLTPAYVPDISQDPFQKLVLWRRRNAGVLWLRNRCTGLTIDNLGARTGRWLVRCSGGGGTLAVEGEYTGDPIGDPAGKVHGVKMTRSGAEQIPTMLLVDYDAYLHRNSFEFTGHAADDADRTCTAAVIEIETDRTVAGSLSHNAYVAENYGGPGEPPAPPHIGTRIWKPMEKVRGFRTDFQLSLQESSGPIVRSNAMDGHDLFKITGDVARPCQGDPSQEMFVIPDGSRLRLKLVGAEITAVRGGAQKVFRIPSRRRLRVIGTDLVATAETVSNMDVDMSDRRLFPATVWRQELVDDEGPLDPDDPDLEEVDG